MTVRESLCRFGHHAKTRFPWWLDIVSAIAELALGAWLICMPAEPNVGAYAFLSRLSDCDVGIATVALGILQIATVVADSGGGRRVAAFLALWHWTAFTLGVHFSDPTARGVTLYAENALMNLIILVTV